MNNPAPQLFTKARLAGMLGVKAQSIAYFLSHTPATERITITDSAGAVRARGVEAWAYDALPAALRDRFEEEARKVGYVNGLALVNANAQPWQPRIPLHEVAPSCQRQAEQLRRALAPSIARKDDTSRAAAEFESLGLADYAREFGEHVTARHWRALLKRVLQRDGGREDWQRLEIYLPEKLFRAPPRAKTIAAMPELQAVARLFANPQEPTWREAALLWSAALQAFAAQCSAGVKSAKAKRAILESLLALVPNIASSFNAARVAFDTRHKTWLAGEKKIATVADKRFRENRAAVQPTAQDVTNGEALAWIAGNEFDGMLPPARREMAARGMLPPTRSRSKSYVEPSLRKLARQDARIVAANKRGKRAIREMLPTLLRDPSKCLVNDAFTADDFTMPVLWYVPDGKGWFTLVEGQCLIVADWRSWRILQFSLQPDRQYSSRDIRTLFTKTFYAHNLPKRLILEGGIWKSSGLIKGNDARRKEVEELGLPYSDGDIIYGLQSQLGIEIRHAISPTGKTQIESIGRIVQDLMWKEKGYAGRDQRKDLPDHIKREQREVETRQAHPSKYFWSFQEWEQRLHDIFAQYNATKQQGIWLHDESPDEAFEKYQNADDPPIAFDARCRHLLAHQVAERTISPRHEIVFEIGKQQYKYFSPQTVQLGAGARVLTWFDPAVPDFLVITDLMRRNPITVPRSNKTDSLNPDDPVTQRELGRKGACASYIKTRFRTLAAKHKPIARTPLVSETTTELGAQIEQQRAAVLTEEKRVERTRRQARRVGLPLTPAQQRRPETSEALEELGEFLKGETSASGKAVKTYVLKSAPAHSLAQLRGAYWKLAKQIEALGQSRHALTHNALGYVKPVKEFSAEELAQVARVFSAAVRDSKKGEQS